MRKKLLLTSVLILFSAILFSQDLSIKGVLVEGNVISFTEKLVSKGFIMWNSGDESNDTYKPFSSVTDRISNHEPLCLKGQLVDQDVFLAVYYTKTSLLVYDVEVIFCNRPEVPANYATASRHFLDNIDSALLFYRGLKNQLQQKYNEPFAVTEYRKKGSSKGTIRSEVAKGETKYMAGYLAAPLGEVIVSLGVSKNRISYNNGATPAYTLCVYLDYINVNNQKINLQEINEKYQSEI